MTTILLITVGGSFQPILTAIRSLEPDRVIFICSAGPKGSRTQITGSGKPCELRRGGEVIERLPNIPTQLGWQDRFNPETDVIELENPDDLAECYSQIRQGIRQLPPTAKLQADYTGGTKTMSLALGAVALDMGIALHLTTGTTRRNLIKVEQGESTELAPTSLVAVERTLNQLIPTLLGQYDYSAAVAQLANLLKTLELPSDQKRRVRTLRDICQGFEAWDRFDHGTAWDLLGNYMPQVGRHGLFLKQVLASRQTIDPKFEPAETAKGHGYEIVEDLLLNAKRRAAQQRYDDAVGRLYRALELLAQIRLWQTYEIATGNVDIPKLSEFLPESLLLEYEEMRSPRKGLVQLALFKSYELLGQIQQSNQPDPLGTWFEVRSQYLLNALEVRNKSLFAHGFQPITADDYNTAGMEIMTFIQTGLERLVPKPNDLDQLQFPQQF